MALLVPSPTPIRMTIPKSPMINAKILITMITTTFASVLVVPGEVICGVDSRLALPICSGYAMAKRRLILQCWQFIASGEFFVPHFGQTMVSIGCDPFVLKEGAFSASKQAHLGHLTRWE